MKTIKKIDVMSLAKIQAVIVGAIYFLMGAGVSLLSGRYPGLGEQLGIPVGLMGFVGVTITGLIMGFIVGVVVALVYNLVAPKVGGIKIEID